MYFFISHSLFWSAYFLLVSLLLVKVSSAANVVALCSDAFTIRDIVVNDDHYILNGIYCEVSLLVVLS